ncbi:MAG: SH3 domain-containing protein [Lachnospiraceae bacterium]|nr:SH3 domain-containing protein [Lachnospiraceae bacterium]
MAVLILAQLPVSAVTADATQSAAAKYSRAYLLTGNKASDIAAVALVQKEKKKADLGYTEAWCADFVCDCAYLTGASDVIPTNGSVSGMYQKLLAANGTQVFLPKQGDLVFYYCTVTKTWVHCGIMINSLQSVEGNYSGKVSLVKGVYRDSHGHSLASGEVIRIFIRPAYNKSKTTPPKTISNNPAVVVPVVPDTTNDTDQKSDTDKKDDTDNKNTTTDNKSDDTKKTDTKSTDTSKKTTTKKLYKKYAGTYKVNTKESPLTMRAKPDKTSDILTSIPKGTKVKVTKATGKKKTDWAYVTYKSFKGYMSMEFLKKVK